jgi:histidinol-phosphate aminotransferase
MAGAIAALEDTAHFERTRKAIMHARENLIYRARSSLGFEVLPSVANFVFVRHPQHDAEKSALALRRHGIVVRHFKLPRIEQFLRITIGTDDQCAILLKALRGNSWHNATPFGKTKTPTASLPCYF